MCRVRHSHAELFKPPFFVSITLLLLTNVRNIDIMSSTRYTLTPTFNLQVITKALDDYTNQTGIDLANHASAMHLEPLDSPDFVLRIFQERENGFSDRSLIKCLRPVVNTLYALSRVIGEAASLVSHTCVVPLLVSLINLSMRSCQGPLSPAKAIFVGIDALLTVRTIPNVLRSDPP